MGCGPSKEVGTKKESLNLSQEAKNALVSHGWDKGYVAFGFSASESTAKVAISLPIAGVKDVTWVTTSFDDSPLEDIPEDFDPNMMTPGSKQKLGVKSELFSLITGGYSLMPCLAIDGEMFTKSDAIVRMLADDTMDDSDPNKKKVLELIDLSIKYSDDIFEALKHWGWTGLHSAQDYAMVDKKNYIEYGNGNKSEEWEKKKTDAIKSLMDKLEETLAAKPEVNGFFIGDSLTLADAALINWVQSLEGVTGLDVKKHYPKCYQNWELVKANPPEGSLHFIYGFPVFCGYVLAANKDAREAGFDINKYF